MNELIGRVFSFERTVAPNQTNPFGTLAREDAPLPITHVADQRLATTLDLAGTAE